MSVRSADVVQRDRCARTWGEIASRKQKDAAGIGPHRHEKDALPVEHKPTCEGNEDDGRTVHPSAVDQPVWNSETRTRIPWPAILSHPSRQARTRRIRRRQWTIGIGTLCLQQLSERLLDSREPRPADLTSTEVRTGAPEAPT
jgi:hypothetical protein